MIVMVTADCDTCISWTLYFHLVLDQACTRLLSQVRMHFRFYECLHEKVSTLFGFVLLIF